MHTHTHACIRTHAHTHAPTPEMCAEMHIDMACVPLQTSDVVELKLKFDLTVAAFAPHPARARATHRSGSTATDPPDSLAW